MIQAKLDIMTNTFNFVPILLFLIKDNKITPSIYYILLVLYYNNNRHLSTFFINLIIIFEELDSHTIKY